MILIVGAGPIGIEMAAELSRCNLPFRIVEAGATASTVAWYAPGTQIFSSPERLAIAGIPFEPQTRKAFREDYLLYLRNVVRQFKLNIEHYRRVVDVQKNENGKFLVSIVHSDHGVGGPLSGGVKTFIENVHVHVNRVLHSLNLAKSAPATPDRPVEEREI